MRPPRLTLVALLVASTALFAARARHPDLGRAGTIPA
jgi:hypothetical protein